MDATKEESNRTPKPLLLTDLAKMAKNIGYIAARYREIAESAEKLGLDNLVVTGRISADRGVSLLKGWLGTLQSALDDHVMDEPTLPTAAESAAEAKQRTEAVIAGKKAKKGK